jgi:bacteriorhodopsin
VLSATLHSSILVQVVTGIVGVLVLLNTAFPAAPLNDVWKMLLVEMTVQAVEFGFYVTWIRRARATPHDMARVRYYDWFLTTPMMLFTLAAYMTYAADRHAADRHAVAGVSATNQTTLADGRGLTGFLKSEARYLACIAAANFGMLIVGFAAEGGHVSRPVAFVVGFLAMALSFGILWQRYARHSPDGRRLFSVVFVVWSLYGVAFMADPVTKNSVYNGLDVVSKNVFGLFLAYNLARAPKEQPSTW